MNSKQQKLKNNKKLRVFFLFFFLSLLFWMLIKLSREYVGQTSVRLDYVDVPENKMLQVDPLDKVTVTLKTIGFNLFKHKISSKKISISLSNLKRKGGTTYYFISSDLLTDVAEEFSKGEVITIKPDTLFFDLGKSTSKKLKVWPNLKIEFQSGFNLSGDLKVDPKEITISGPKAQVDSIIEIKTKLLELSNVNESIDREVAIDINKKYSKINYSDTKVKVIGTVEKFTERTISTKFRIINGPSTHKIVTFPKEVELVFQIGLSDFNKIDKKDFSVVCDYSDSKLNEIDYLIPKLVKKPTIVKDVKIIPSKIQFLLEK